jgi:hypothetical protein
VLNKDKPALVPYGVLASKLAVEKKVTKKTRTPIRIAVLALLKKALISILKPMHEVPYSKNMINTMNVFE